jgi:quinoprotein glucose dehydrogenase
LWDRDVCSAGILCDIPHNGRTVKAIALPTKQAFLYVLDRTNGKPVWPIPERPAPKGDVPGEYYSPTQPVPTKPPPFDRQGFTEDDLIDFTPAIKARALAISKHYHMGPLLTPPALIDESKQIWGTLTLPGLQGGANWPGGSYDPDTHMVYVFSKTIVEMTSIRKLPDGSVQQGFALPTPNTADPNGGSFGGNAALAGGTPRFRGLPINPDINAPITAGMIHVAGLPLNKPPYGRITAIDLNKGTIAWQVAHGETPDFIRNHPLLKGVTIPRTGQAGILGTLTTKSLVICGDAGLFTDEQGRKGARLRAYDKATGKEVGAIYMDKCQTGAAMTYMHNGKQYIVTAIGSRFGAELVAYRLPGGSGTPEPRAEER